MRAGDHHVGVRTDDPGVLEDLRVAFAAQLVDDPSATDDFCVVIEGRREDAPRLLPYLAHGKQPLLRTRSRARLLRRLDLTLGRLAGDAPPEAGELHGTGALVRGDRAVLVPRAVIERASVIERPLAAAGVGISEAVATRLLPATREVLVLPGLAGVDGHAALRDDLAVDPGGYSLTGIFWSGRDDGAAERPAAALVRLYQEIVDLRHHDTGAILEQLAALRHLFSPVLLAERGATDLAPVLDRLG